MHPPSFICSSPHWHLSGVNTFTANLFQEFDQQGITTEIVLTETNGTSNPLPLPCGIKVTKLPITRWGAVRQRQALLRRLLLSKAPCVYLPNYDFNHLPVIEVLPESVKAVLIAHSDEGVYYEAISRYGAAANAIVAVSKTIENKLRHRHPEWHGKIVRIPYGVPVPKDDQRTKPGVTRPRGQPLHVVYSGRLSQNQKRIFDLAEIILSSRRRRLPVKFSLAGSGPDEDELKRRLQPALADGTARLIGTLPIPEMNGLFREADVLILTSEYEGLPLSLLEAMARRCVPVVSQIESGIDELVRHDQNGFTAPVGDTDRFVMILENLTKDRATLSLLAQAASETIRNGPYNIVNAANAFRELVLRTEGAEVRRRSGEPDVPIHYAWSYRIKKRFLSQFAITRKNTSPSR